MADSPILLDTGPLISYLRQDDEFHVWATQTANALPFPLLTSESVISEARFLLHRAKLGPDPLFELLNEGSVVIAFDLDREHKAIAMLLEKYADLPMSLADASLVRLAELYENAAVFTLDRHFRVYRKHGRRQIPLIIPDSR